MSISHVEEAIKAVTFIEQVFLYVNRYFPVTVAVVTLNHEVSANFGIKIDNNTKISKEML